MPKLHIPGSGKAATACGRQLNNHRADRVQDSSNAAIAGSLDEYLTALEQGKACRFCGQASGIIPKPVRRSREEQNWGDEDQ